MADNQIEVYNPEQPQPRVPFNPNEHLMRIKNRGGAQDYLPVQWRLVWFRELCPNGTIETEIVHLDLDRETEEETYAWNNETRRSEKIMKRAPGLAVFRATVKDGKGGVATGTKSEKAASFGDFIEKAETGAIGRALAALGYGTQFAPELDEHHRIVDSPVENHPQQNQGTQRKPTPAEAEAYQKRRQVVDADPVKPAATEPIDEAPATEVQLNSLRKLYEHFGFQMPKRSLTYAQAKKAIQKAEDEMRKEQDAKAVPLDQVSAEMAAQKQEAHA